MNVGKYLQEHKVEGPRIVKHAAPYFIMFWTFLGSLVAWGWLDVPARSQDLRSVEQRAIANEHAITKLNDILDEIQRQDAARTETLRSIEQSQERTRRAVERMTEYLINNRYPTP